MEITKVPGIGFRIRITAWKLTFFFGIGVEYNNKEGSKKA